MRGDTHALCVAVQETRTSCAAFGRRWVSARRTASGWRPTAPKRAAAIARARARTVKAIGTQVRRSLSSARHSVRRASHCVQAVRTTTPRARRWRRAASAICIRSGLDPTAASRASCAKQHSTSPPPVLRLLRAKCGGNYSYYQPHYCTLYSSTAHANK